MPAFPALTAKPVYPLTPDGDLEDAVVRSPQEAGYEQTRPRFTRARRSFGLNYTFKEADADETALRAFELTTLRNGADSFTWTHPTRATSHTVRLTGPIAWSRAGFNDVKVSFVLREV